MNIIKSYRKQHKLTQGDIAAKLGITQGMVCHIEKGLRLISPDKARELERLTGGVITRQQLRPDIFTD